MNKTQMKNINKYGEGKIHRGLASSVSLLDEHPIVISKKLEHLSARLSKLNFGHPIKKQAD